MSRREPPQLAKWMLEHFASSDLDDAVAGDLLEVFHSGRSSGWFWRQAIAACAISWGQSLRARTTLLIFAFLWSLLAPAWAALIAWIERASHLFDAFAAAAWPVSLASRLAVWLAFNSAFLWAGMLLFMASCRRAGTEPRGRQRLRELFLAPAVFLPIYVVMFIAMNLFAYPGFDVEIGTIQPLREISDITLRADVLRLPYFIALVCALWGRSAAFALWMQRRAAQSLGVACEQEGELLLMSRSPAADPTLLSAQAILAGFISALVATLIFSLWIDGLAKSLGLLPAALLSLGETVFAGSVGAVLFGAPLAERSWARVLQVTRACGPAWVWLPPTVFLDHRGSLFALPAAATCAAMSALCVCDFASASRVETVPAPGREMFADTLQPIPWDWHASVIALCAYAALVSVQIGESAIACACVALSAFFFASQWMGDRGGAAQIADAKPGSPSLFQAAMAALLLTLISIMATSRWLGVKDALSAKGEVQHAQPARPKQLLRQTGFISALDSAGYRSIVLWPLPPKKEIVPPIPPAAISLEPSAHKPLVVRFTGAYWYFQPPATRPESSSHVAHGSPLNLNIRSVNSLPLKMEANQALAGPVRVARCGEIEVTVESRSEGAGPVSVGLRLSDTSARTAKSLFLGSQPVTPARATPAPGQDPPVTETLRFAVPIHSALRRFDEITLVVTRDSWESAIGARLAVDQFEFMPR